MRKIGRIDTFCNELARIWKTYCPDWRFGQLISNVLGTMHQDGQDSFFLEEDEMLKYFKSYFGEKK